MVENELYILVQQGMDIIIVQKQEKVFGLVIVAVVQTINYQQDIGLVKIYGLEEVVARNVHQIEFVKNKLH